MAHPQNGRLLADRHPWARLPSHLNSVDNRNPERPLSEQFASSSSCALRRLAKPVSSNGDSRSDSLSIPPRSLSPSSPSRWGDRRFGRREEPAPCCGVGSLVCATCAPTAATSPGDARRVLGDPSAPRVASAELPEADPLSWGSDPEAGAHAGDRREPAIVMRCSPGERGSHG